MDLLLPAAIADGLATRRFGRQVHHHEVAGSTNDLARDLALAGAPEGTVVIAEEQISGRGRLGRTWLAPPRSCLLFSVIFRPMIPASAAFRLTMLSSVAAAVAVEKVTRVTPSIKWPNDLLVGERKLAGILSEASAMEDRLQFAIVGIGLNVNFDPDRFPDIAATATSLRAQTGREVSRVRLLQALLAEMESRYETLVAGEEDELFAEWRLRLAMLGQQVTVSEGEHREHGTAVDVAADGSLVLRRDDGSTRFIAVGDVTLRV